MVFLSALALAAAPATLDLDKPGEIVSAMQKAGYSAELERDEAGDAVIHSKANGAKFVVIFFGCDKGKDCTDLQFYAGWATDEKEDPSKINAFNQDYRFTRAYIDQDHDPVIEMDVMGVEGTIDAARFDRALDAWSGLMGLYMAQLASD